MEEFTIWLKQHYSLSNHVKIAQVNRVNRSLNQSINAATLKVFCCMAYLNRQKQLIDSLPVCKTLKSLLNQVPPHKNFSHVIYPTLPMCSSLHRSGLG